MQIFTVGAKHSNSNKTIRDIDDEVISILIEQIAFHEKGDRAKEHDY